MVLELDPRFPVLWRSARAVQFGVDDPRVFLHDVGFAEELMIDALRIGTSGGTVRTIGSRAGASAERVEEVLAILRPVLRRRSRAAPARPVVLVDGGGPTASAVRALLQAEGCALTDGDDDAVRPQLVVLIAAFAIAPARSARWLTADVPHLAVVFGDEAVRVGPLVEPGAGPCLHCLDRRRIDADPAWPRLVVQLLGRTAPTETALASGFIAAAVADLVLRRLHGGARTLRATARLHRDASGAFSEFEVLPHPECGCRSLAESATAGAGPSGRPPGATTTGASAAVPA